MGMSEAWLLAGLPAGAFVILLLFGRYLPRHGDWLSIAAIGASFVLIFPVLADLLDKIHGGVLSAPGLSGWDWIEYAGFRLRLGFAVDQLTIVMLVVVSFVALMVQVYSVGYMKDDPHYGWFFTCMSLFAAAMLTLVLADNFLLLYIAWEGVGFCSYLLIGFWNERRSAAEAAKKAFVTTRIGDVGLLIGIIMLWRATGTFDMREIFHAAEAGVMSQPYLTTAVILIFAGAIGKSAQFPLHVWLPDAMEGPTPVSALIHAATMVVAGVYLVARTLPLFELAHPAALDLVTGLGLTTVLMSATMGLVMTDVKRVVAYSTINSLGLMMVALGSGQVAAAMIYLLAHGFFKALLFLSSGSILHATEKGDVQELGGLWRKMPVTGTVFGIGVLAMAGIPPLSGFWAKDEIILSASQHQNAFVYALMALSVFITGLYMARLFILTFTGEPRDRHAHEHAHDAPPVMTVPLILLAILALVAGFVVFDQVGDALGFPGGIGKFVYIEAPEAFKFHGAVAAVSIIAALAGVLGAFYFWWGEARPAKAAGARFPFLYALWKNKYYMDDLYQALIDRVILTLGRFIAWWDRNIVNDTGVDGSAALAVYSGFRLKFSQTGRLPNYAFAIILGVVALAIIAMIVFV